MWETIDYIVKYVIQHGGIWGLLAVLAAAWILYREWMLSKKNSSKGSDDSKSKDSFSEIIKERQEDQTRVLEQNSEKITEVSQKLQDISNHIDTFVEINKSNNEKIERLTEQLQQVNDERVEELKEILASYNKTMNELALTLQKIKFVLKTRLGEK